MKCTSHENKEMITKHWCLDVKSNSPKIYHEKEKDNSEENIHADIGTYYSTNCHYAHIWQRRPQYLSSVHDRDPAIYVDVHISKCTADFLSQPFWQPFWKARQFEQCSLEILTPWKKLSMNKCSQKVNKYLLQLTEISRGWLGIFIVRTEPRKCYCERSSTLAHGKL